MTVALVTICLATALKLQRMRTREEIDGMPRGPNLELMSRFYERLDEIRRRK